jgi:hypothetical protein
VTSDRPCRVGPALLLIVACLLLTGCAGRRGDGGPSIRFTKIPPADKGGPDTLDVIEGRVAGARPGQRIVLFSKSGVWWVQPEAKQPFTEIRADSTWTSPTHLGTEYAALIVDAGYRPPLSTETLPTEGGGIVAVTIVPGDTSVRAAHHTLQFSGYEWIARAAPSDRGGTNDYDPANAWTDERGAMHLRIGGEAPRWTCAEVRLTRRLGYGSYRFVVRDVSYLEPAAVLTLFTWDGPATNENHREMDLEISRWGNPAATNAQYVVQPYYVGANVWPFVAPPGVLTHSLRWEPGRLTARTFRGEAPEKAATLVTEHTFSSGVPAPGNEAVRMNLYVFRRSVNGLQHGAEVVIEKFEYLP